MLKLTSGCESLKENAMRGQYDTTLQLKLPSVLAEALGPSVFLPGEQTGNLTRGMVPPTTPRSGDKQP
jgi:hypothetical protein